MRGYGKIVILKHVDGFFTVYAHNKENLVKMGEEVVKGASIATVGSSGNATTTHLHFEVRYGKTVRNPLFFLPSFLKRCKNTLHRSQPRFVPQVFPAYRR